jgi:hypothetical protein
MSGQRWLVYFQETTGTLTVAEGEAAAMVRCVRGGATSGGTGRFTDSTSSVADTVSGLEWTRDIAGGSDWLGALAGCEALVLDGHSDWRLPNAKEMLSVLSDTRAHPAVDTAHFRWPAHQVWTSTAMVATAGDLHVGAFMVSLDDGTSTEVPNRAGYLQYACVRGN